MPKKSKKSKRSEADVHAGLEHALTPFKFLDAIRPGTLLNLQGRDPREATFKLGTLWVWSRTDTEHYLVQTSHLKHCHRVQCVFWTAWMAVVMRKLIERGMASGDLAVYTLLRAAGIAPMTQYRDPPKKPKAKS